MEHIATQFLLWLAVVTGSTSIPEEHHNWKIVENWNLTLSHPQLVIQSDLSNLYCSKDKYLKLPTLLYGAVDIKAGTNFFRSFGDSSFNSANYVFNSPVIKCNELPAEGIFQVTFKGYSPSYSVIKRFPEVHAKKGHNDFFFKYSYAGGAFALILLSVFLCFATFAREERLATLLTGVSAFSIALYQLGVISSSFDISLSMLDVHRYSDRALGVGFIIFFYVLKKEKMLSPIFFGIHAFFFLIGLLINMTAASGDSIQMGTTIQFPTAFVCFTAMLCGSLYKIIKRKDKREALVFFSAFALTSAMASEMMVFTGGGEDFSVFPLGVNVGFLIFGIILNRKIESTYIERDYLRKNLEQEVRSKTSELRQKTSDLENTLSELRSTQAELIQSAKLASLGTLSAGIAHEINNSINYVNGALIPLEKQILSSIEDQTKKEKIQKLFSVMKDGVNLTVEIIKSLRNYTGLNQAKMNDVDIELTFNSVLVILRSRLRDKIKVQLNIDKNLKVYGSVVGLNQLFMNLISNAIDAMPEDGTITIIGKKNSNSAVISISDSGIGMAEDVKNRIFDPFFTTKEVGQGTGLGLHIVKKEVEKHHGEITVDSVLGKGTSFTVVLPCNKSKEDGGIAA